MQLQSMVETPFRFLAEANALLDASLDYPTALEHVTQMVVPQLADYCAIHVINDRQALEIVAYAHRDPSKRAILEALLQRYPPDVHADTPASRVFRTGQAVLARTVPSLVDPPITRDA